MNRRDETVPDWQVPYRLLHAAFGAQHWWPGDSPFEVMVGAVLTQNTAWSNVERAIASLREADALTCPGMLALPVEELARLIRPAGYFNVKARRLLALCHFLQAEAVADAPESLRGRAPLAALRQLLLGVHGVGEETADSILLYALDLPSFVVDAYTRRIFGRIGLLHGEESYAMIQRAMMAGLPSDTALYNEYHALIVHLGKHFCRPRPRCTGCPLSVICRHEP